MVHHLLLSFLPISIPTDTSQRVVDVSGIHKYPNLFTFPLGNVDVKIIGVIRDAAGTQVAVEEVGLNAGGHIVRNVVTQCGTGRLRAEGSVRQTTFRRIQVFLRLIVAGQNGSGSD